MLLFPTWDNDPLLLWPNFFLLLIVHLLLILTHMCSSFYGEKFELTYGLLVCIYMWHSLGNESDVSCCNSMQSWNLKLKDFLSKYIFICINLFTFWSAQHYILNYIILSLILNQGLVQQNLPQNWEWSETAEITNKQTNKQANKQTSKNPQVAICWNFDIYRLKNVLLMAGDVGLFM